MHKNAKQRPEGAATGRRCQSCSTELTGMSRRLCRPCTFLTLLNFQLRTEMESELLEGYEHDTQVHRDRTEDLTKLLEWRIALQRGIVSDDEFAHRFPDLGAERE